LTLTRLCGAYSQICAGAGKHCDPATMHDEGTPEIVSKDANGFFYVTFHGYACMCDFCVRICAEELLLALLHVALRLR
jgi:hypothetical protein